MLPLSHFTLSQENMQLPVSDAVASVVAKRVVVRSPPSDIGPGSTTHFTS